MNSHSRIAFKEWGVVCEAVAAGAQTLLIRKGGINEGREGLRINHDQFWLYPTLFHQGAESLIPEAKRYWESVRSHSVSPSHVPISLYASVADVHEVKDLARLKALTGMHILADSTVEQRFHYRHPGVFVIVARVYRLQQPVTIAESPSMAGCKSWVELPENLPTDGLAPILEDEVFATRRDAIRKTLFDQ